MGPARLETFSDGVIAILITIMVLELKPPHTSDPALLLELWPTFLSYLSSYLVIAIYWVNHHHLFHPLRHINNAVLWTNIFWLFCISLIPFATAYMGENHFDSVCDRDLCDRVTDRRRFIPGDAPRRRCALHRRPSDAQIELRAARKNPVSLSLYAISIPLAYVHPAITLVLAVIVATIYFLPNAWLGRTR